jgi:hypothetical protein
MASGGGYPGIGGPGFGGASSSANRKMIEDQRRRANAKQEAAKKAAAKKAAAVRKRSSIPNQVTSATGQRSATPQGLPPGVLRVVCTSPPTNLLLLMGTQPLKVTAGWGGWEVTGRPRDVGMTTWSGVEPYQVQFSVMLEGWGEKPHWVEPGIRALLAITRGDSEDQPGVISVYGISLPAKRWVIEDMSFEDPIMWSHSRVRQEIGMTLREYQPPAYENIRHKALHRPGKAARARTIKTRKGETVHDVARRLKVKWTDLKKANPKKIHKAGQHLATGTTLRVPQHKDKK